MPLRRVLSQPVWALQTSGNAGAWPLASRKMDKEMGAMQLCVALYAHEPMQGPASYAGKLTSGRMNIQARVSQE